MFFFYQIILTLALPLSPLIILFRILKNKEDKKRFTEKFSISSKIRRNGKLIWFHGASVGEILSIIPIIKNYEKKKSINQILITSSTLSSSKVLEKYKFKKTIHQFYPIDHIYFTNKFLKYWRPNLAIFIESEIWPCMYKNIYNYNIPLILLNARLTKKTFNRWIKIKQFSKSIFNKILIAYPQNIETKKFLKKINPQKIKMLGIDGIYSQITQENLPLIRGLSSSFGLLYTPGPYIETIQIIKGTGSVINGFESFTGQINLEYFKPDSPEKFYYNIFGTTEGKLENNFRLIKRNGKWKSNLFLHHSYHDMEIDHNNDYFLDMPHHNHFNLFKVF